VHERLSAERGPGDVSLCPDEPLLQCPMHSWDFDLHTGRCTADPRFRVASYSAAVRDGRIFVTMAD
jgi:nitrite reductase/ring-hydroxylating ferredoxin subunit